MKSGWHCREHRKRAGRRYCYSDGAIEAILSVRVIYGLSLRAVQGFFEGFMQGLIIPHYSRLSRRAKDLEIEISRMKKEGKKPTDLVIDSTGLKVYGEGEWKTRIHGKDKRRTWRKYHVSVDPNTHEVVAQELNPQEQSLESIIKHNNPSFTQLIHKTFFTAHQYAAFVFFHSSLVAERHH